MTAPTLRERLDEYLVMRRALGFQQPELAPEFSGVTTRAELATALDA